MPRPFHHPLTFILLLVAAFGPVGETTAAPPTPSLFRQLIKQPTGQNGYEELVQAVDALSASKLYGKVEALPDPSEVTLSLKRQVLLDPPVVRALSLLRRGLAKPISSPPETATGDGGFSVWSGFRRLARLLQLQQYVLLADGRTADAIANARLGLRFGQAVQSGVLLSGLVGVAISRVATASLSAHLDQLSARDCELLVRVCLEWLGEPSPVLRVIEGERREIRRRLAEQMGEAPEVMRLQTQKQLDEILEREIAELRKPAWKRSPVTVPADGTIAAALAALLLPSLERAGDSFTGSEARIRLLAGHAAIRRYRWEHDRLPDTLAELDLGDLAIDPFTGQPLQYERQGAGYRLTSVGPTAEADNPRAVNGRVPISIVPGEQ